MLSNLRGCAVALIRFSWKNTVDMALNFQDLSFEIMALEEEKRRAVEKEAGFPVLKGEFHRWMMLGGASQLVSS